MALETLTVQTVDRTGLEQTYETITTAGGFRFLNDGKTLLAISNDAGNCEIGFTIPVTVDGEAVATKIIDVTASEIWVMGPFPTRWYNDANGYCVCTVETDLVDAGEGARALSVVG